VPRGGQPSNQAKQLGPRVLHFTLLSSTPTVDIQYYSAVKLILVYSLYYRYVLKLCTVISTLRWAVLTVLCIGFCHTGLISLCVDLFVFISVYFVCFCFILHSCCIIVSMVGWTWWDWSLILRTYFPSVLWHCWLGHLTHKNPSPIWPIMCLVRR